MATADNNNALITDNGIFRTKKNNELRCWICTKDAIANDWQKHIENSCHVGTLERFNLTFQRRDPRLNCKICSNELDWNMLKDHAYFHKIVPWYEPDDRYKQFFENRIQEWETRFYCHPCDIIFPEWSTAFAHITEKKHQNLILDGTPIINSASFSTVETLYELLVSEGFVSWSEDTVKCRICNCPDIRLRDIFLHIRGAQHSDLKSKFVSILKKRSRNETIEKQSLEYSENKESTSEPAEANILPLAQENLPSDSTASCRSLQNNSPPVDQNLPNDSSTPEYSENKESTSKSAETNILPLAQENFLNDSPASCKNLQSNSSPADQNSPNDSAAPDKNSQNNSQLACKSLSCIYVVRQNATDGYCKICDLKLIGQTSIDYHVASTWHVTALKIHGCDKISQKDDNDYYCECCNCAIPDLENVYRHVKETRHMNALLNKREMPTIDESPVKVEAPKESADASHATRRSLSSDYVLKLNNVDFCCRICNVLFSDQAFIDVHIAGKLHETSIKFYGCDSNISLMDGKRYHCSCCDCVISSIEEIRLHTTSVRHRSFLNSADKQEVPPSNEIEVETVPTEQPEDSQKSSPSYYMIKLNDTDVHCKICDLVLSGQTAVNDHTAGKQHAAAFRQHGCYNIVQNANNTYYCKTCRCHILVPDKIFMHIKGYAHRTRQAELEGNKLPVKVEPQPLLKNLFQAAPQSLVHNFGKKINNGYSSPKTRDHSSSVQTTVEDFITKKPNATALQQYGGDSFISPMGGNKYYCECCNCEIPSLANIYGHAITSKHKSFLKGSVTSSTEQQGAFWQSSPCWYIVKLNDTDFHCKVCDLLLSGQTTVKVHAAGEQHAAALKRYGCYNISLRGGIDYYCKSCHCQIPGLPNVYLHIKGIRHKASLPEGKFVPQKKDYSGSNEIPVKAGTQQELLKNASQSASQELRPDSSNQLNNSSPKTDDLLPPVQASASKQYTGDSYITLIDGSKYHCRCCDCTIPSFENIYVHVTGNRHKSFLKDSSDQPTAPDQSSFCYYIVKLGNTDFHCMICNLQLSDQATAKDHAAGEQHVTALKRYSCENISPNGGNSYYCKSCRCRIPNLANVYLHIKGPRHMSLSPKTSYVPKKLEVPKTNINPMKVETPNQLENGTKISRQIVPVNYIMQLNNTEFFCKICNLPLTGQTTVNDHLEEKLHAVALDKYGCDNISPREKGKYYCGCCNCEIPNLENVYRHIKGQRHSLNVSNNPQILTAKGQASKTADEEEISKNLDVNTVLSSLVTGLSTLLENLDPTKPKIVGKSLSNDPAIEQQQKNILPDQIPCSVSLASAVKLQSQLTSYLDQEKFDSSKNKKDVSENMNNCLEADKVEQNFERGSQLTSTSEDRLAIRDTKVFSKSVDNNTLCIDVASNKSNINNLSSKITSMEPTFFNLENENINTSDDHANLVSPASSQISSTRTANSVRKPRVPRNTSVKKVVDVFDHDNDYIHEMKDKWEEIQLGMKLCFAIDTKNIYCFVCGKAIEVKLDNYIEHLRSLEHCENLEGMKTNHALFEVVLGQFSDFDLALRYMEEMSEDVIHCYICDEDVENIDNAVQTHIDNSIHEQRCREAQKEAQEKFEKIKSRTQCDWYTIHKYRCEPCSTNFQNEFSFAKHLKCTSHAIVMKRSKVDESRLIYDCCASCSLLWYGSRTTYADHCDNPTHKLIMHNERWRSPDLPTSAKLLLATSEEYIEATISYMDAVYRRERRKEETLICDVEKAVKLQFPQAKIYTFGSRASDLSSPDSDIDLFLDSGNMYEGNELSKDRTMAFVDSVHQWLSKDSQSWETVQLSTNFQAKVPVIKAQHKATGLCCSMSFENGLGVENTKLIKLINDTFPICRKMTLFLKQWLAFCDLSGSERISNYALCWYVIFFLQKTCIVPSIATLIATEKNLRTIAGWEVGLSRELGYNKAECNSSVKEFLIQLFAYYARFDYRYDVACPLLGKELKKRVFMDLQNLPKQMGAYVAYIRNSDDTEPFRIDSAMCIQDPFDLQRNLTKDVNKVYVSRFQIYCAKSFELLNSS